MLAQFNFVGSTTILDWFYAKKGLQKHRVDEKWDDFEKKQNWPFLEVLQRL